MPQRYRATAQRMICAAAAVALIPIARPACASDAVFYRLFLRDGGTVVSYGDFARVADRVVLSVPIGGTDANPELQLVSLPESAIDWEQTDRYAYAARAKRYADTRGELEFSQLADQVARALNEAALSNDASRRLAVVDAVRRQLVEWPSRNFGYRASDVAQLGAMLDQVVSELRVAAGQSRFDLSLVAGVTVPPTVELMPLPGRRETIELAFVAAKATAEPAERVSLLRAIARALKELPGDETWKTALYERATTDLLVEVRADRAYAQIASRILPKAEQRARQADVRGLQTLVATVLEEDDRLGRLRPGATAALLATLDSRIDAARRLVLARDAWRIRVNAVRKYRQRVKRPLERLGELRAWLADVRQLAGPTPRLLTRLESRAAVAGRELALIKPPAELEAAHGLLSTVSRLAVHAAERRRAAVVSGDLQTAWDASAAAAGALMTFDRALDDLKRLSEFPQLQ
jgi:hypothetical protein